MAFFGPVPTIGIGAGALVAIAFILFGVIATFLPAPLPEADAEPIVIMPPERVTWRRRGRRKKTNLPCTPFLPDYPLYLAVPSSIYATFFQGTIIQQVIHDNRIKLLVDVLTTFPESQCL